MFTKPLTMTDMFQLRDIEVLYNYMLNAHKTYKSAVKKIKTEETTIHYIKEGLTKILPLDAVEVGNNACLAYWRDYEDWNLNDAENQFLLDFNERLRSFESELRKELDIWRKKLENKKKEWVVVHDFMIGIVLTYSLDQNDPWYKKNSNNILFQYNPIIDFNEFTPGGFDWNDMNRYVGPSLPIRHVPHCRLFHDLESLSPLPLKHICRIGQIWTDLKIEQKNFSMVDRVSAEIYSG